ncbi:hypothetical protein F4X88_14400 [Candidatus Poribacteria bacterium]|nr:hypothetical protein [Candidatus Poribacteria bacterium]
MHRLTVYATSMYELKFMLQFQSEMVLHKKPVPGASVNLIATFTRDEPSKATAIVENIATGDQKTVGVGSMFAGYQVLDIQAKQILIEKDGERAIWKRMKPFLLN